MPTPDFTDLRSRVALAESLRGANLMRYSIDQIEASLEKLLEGHSLQGVARSSEQIWFRGRRCKSDEGYPNLYQCIYQPKDQVMDYGRCHYPGEPTFYASWNQTAVFGELRARPGDYVQIILARIKAGLQLPCYVVGEIQHVFNTGASLINQDSTVAEVWRMQRTLKFEEMLREVFLDGFLAEQFASDVRRSFEYMLTAAFARELLNAGGGVIYPSVAIRGAMNVAVASALFDSSFEVLATDVWKVEDYFGYGAYACTRRRASCDFREDGEIIWDSPKRADFTTGPRGDLRPLNDGIKGWCIPMR